jgi:hypothetical protein
MFDLGLIEGYEKFGILEIKIMKLKVITLTCIVRLKKKKAFIGVSWENQCVMKLMNNFFIFF